MHTPETPLVLLVDDYSTNLQLLETLLERYYHIAVASDGIKALEIVDQKKPDLILLDVMMPDMDGFEVCRRLQASPNTRDIPIIFLTARTDGEDIKYGFGVGAVDYVTKPFRKEELLARVHTHIKLKQAENILRQGLAEAQRIARMGSWVWDIQAETLIWSDEIYRIFGASPEEFGVTYETFLEAVHPDDRDMVKESIENTLNNRKPYSIDHRILLSDGSERIVHEEGRATFNEGGTAIRMLGTIQDITEKKQIEAELRKLSTAIEESTNIIFITDIQGKIEYINPMFERITGYSRDEIIGQHSRILASDETSRQQYKDLWKSITAGESWQGRFKNRKKNGEKYWVDGVISPIKAEDGTVTHFLAIQEDISEKMLAEQRAQYLTQYDKTTGLLNRETFLALLDDRISKHQHGSLVLINLDEFKLINEAYGHNTGDAFLKQIGGLLKKLAEERTAGQSVIGRLGKDEIAIAIPGENGQEGWRLAEELRKHVENYTFPTEAIRTTLSAGIVECPTHGTSSTELLSRVDGAVLRAKELGKNRCHLFTPKDKDIEHVHSRLRQKERILKALEEDRFEPWFQPLLDLRDNQVHHYEALARLRDSNGDIILPGAFIATAEALGLIGAIDRAMMKKVIAHQAHLKDQGEDLSFAMNLSGKHLGDDELLKFLQSTIDSTGADPGHLIFEITETATIQDLKQAIIFIDALKTMGCQFALDDFGVGFTSFVYLREMTVDFLKIDGVFIRRLHEHREDQGIVKAITTVAKEMGIRTVAEFVEYEETLHLLKGFGIDYAQGFLIGKPAPAPQ